MNALYRHRHLVSVGQLRKWELSNEVEKKQWRLSFIHGMEIISNK